MVWNFNFQKIQFMMVILSGVIPVGNGRKSVILYQKDFMSAFSYTVRNEFDEKDWHWDYLLILLFHFLAENQAFHGHFLSVGIVYEPGKSLSQKFWSDSNAMCLPIVSSFSEPTLVV